MQSGRFMSAKSPIRSSIVLESRPSAVVGVCREILSKLEGNGFSKEDVFGVHLALEEAFVNAVRHGNGMDPSKKVKVDYSVGPDEVEICLTDEGEGFDPGSVPDPRDGDNLYKPDGRGLLLISAYMDLVEFNERGNRVRMVRYKKRERPDESETEPKA